MRALIGGAASPPRIGARRRRRVGQKKPLVSSYLRPGRPVKHPRPGQALRLAVLAQAGRFRINDLRAAQNSVAQNHPSSSAGPQMDCLQLFAELCPAIVSGMVSDLQMSLDHLRRFGRAARRIVERSTIGRDDSRRQYTHCSLVWTAFVTPLIPVRLRSMKP